MSAVVATSPGGLSHREDGMRLRVVLVAGVLGLAALSGCGGGPALAPVTGRVLCNGKPVTAAHVIFSPVAASEKDLTPGRSATGFSGRLPPAASRSSVTTPRISRGPSGTATWSPGARPIPSGSA